jgi:hypothetical protein
MQGAKLFGLYLSDNELDGPIPSSICGLESLRALFLDENQLNGSIPSCINRLSNLVQLFLFGNQLTGDVPSQLSSLRKLSKYSFFSVWRLITPIFRKSCISLKIFFQTNSDWKTITFQVPYWRRAIDRIARTSGRTAVAIHQRYLVPAAKSAVHQQPVSKRMLVKGVCGQYDQGRTACSVHKLRSISYI